MGELIQFPRHRIVREPPLSMPQLMKALGRSRRWIQYQIAEGMPHERMPNGWLRFTLSEVEEWLEQKETA